MNFTVLKYAILFLNSEIYIVHVINHEWNRSMFIAYVVCFVWDTKLDFPTTYAYVKTGKRRALENQEEEIRKEKKDFDLASKVDILYSVTLWCCFENWVLILMIGVCSSHLCKYIYIFVCLYLPLNHWLC